MTDKELLELAAKAAGIGGGCSWPDGFRKEDKSVWNPLTDDGDAMRLAVKLDIPVDSAFVCRTVGVVAFQDDQYAATRRAIVLAAAEIGKGMK